MNIPSSSTFHTTANLSNVASQHTTATLADSSLAELDEPPISGLTSSQIHNHNQLQEQQEQQEQQQQNADSTHQSTGGHPAGLHPRLRGRIVSASQGPERSASVPDLRRQRSAGSSSEVDIPQHVARTSTTLSATALSGAPFMHKFSINSLSPGANNQAQAAAAGAGANARPVPFTEVLLTPKRPVGKPPGWKQSLINTVKFSWLNVLLIFIPISWAMDLSHQNPVVTFFTSFAAIVPLAALLGFATEELALRVGDALGGLLNATFGNAVELIISILALVKGELRVVQSSMLGSILSNLLLVLGMCFFAGGLRFHEQGYESRSANLNINLLGVAVISIIIPVGFISFVGSNNLLGAEEAERDIKMISRGTAILLLITYVAYLIFQLWTHAYLYVPTHLEPGEKRGANAPHINGPQPPSEGGVFRIPSLPSWGSSSSASSIMTHEDLERAAADPEAQSLHDKDHNVPSLNVIYSFVLLAVVTGLTGVTAEFLVSSIDGMVANVPALNIEFVSFVLLPLVGNAAEHISAVTMSSKGKLDLALSIAVGSSIQIALFVIPLLMLIAWIIGQPLTMAFDELETLILFLSVCGVNFAISDGRSNWMEGFSLMAAYCLVALIIFFYPGTSPSTL